MRDPRPSAQQDDTRLRGRRKSERGIFRRFQCDRERMGILPLILSPLPITIASIITHTKAILPYAKMRLEHEIFL